MQQKTGRHTPAFILLFLKDGPAYGAQILSRMEAQMPHCFTDSAGLYRALQILEKEKAVESFWDIPSTGAPTKVYKITALGQEVLQTFAQDIRLREKNFRFFLEKFELPFSGSSPV